jgi:hypothetical protein
VYGLDALIRQLPTRAVLRSAALSLIGLALFLYAATSLYFGFVEPILTVVGGVVLLLLHRRGRISPRATAVGFVLIALVAGYASGVETGRAVRDDAAYQTPVVLTTQSGWAGCRELRPAPAGRNRASTSSFAIATPSTSRRLGLDAGRWFSVTSQFLNNGQPNGDLRPIWRPQAGAATRHDQLIVSRHGRSGTG